MKTATTAPVKAEPPPSNVPEGWDSVGTWQIDAALERILTSPAGRDFAPLVPLLQALVDAPAKSSD